MLDNFIKFFTEHWEALLLMALSVLSFVLALIRKKPVLNKLDYYLSELLVQVPVFIDLVEKKGHGTEKKLVVLEMCNQFLIENFGFYDFDLLKNDISQYIESVLTTPQKKLYNFDDEKED